MTDCNHQLKSYRSGRVRNRVARLLCAVLTTLVAPVQAELSPLMYAEYAALPEEELAAAFRTASAQDTPQRIDLGLVLADHYANYAPHLALDHLNELVKAADATLSAQQRLYAAAVRCTALLRLAHQAEAKQVCSQETGADQVSNLFIQIRTMSARAFWFLQQGKFEEALETTFRMERTATELGHPFILARALQKTATVFNFSSLDSQALERYARAYQNLEAFSDHPLRKVIAFNLGRSYSELGQHELALAAFEEGYNWARETGQTHRAHIARVSMATVLTQLGRQDEGLRMITDLLDEPSDGQNPDTRLHAHMIAGEALLELERLNEAAGYFTAGAQLARQVRSDFRWGGLELSRLLTLERLGQQELAYEPTKELVKFLREQPSENGLRTALRLLARLESHAGDHAAAYELSETAAGMASATQNTNDHRKLALLEVANELQLADRETAIAQAAERELRANAERNRLIGWGGGLLFLLSVTVVVFDLQRRRQRQHAIAYRQSSEQLAQQVHERTREAEESTAMRVQAEQERSKLEQELIEADKMRSLGQLTGGVAHDFNNLLTVVAGSADLLREDPDMPDTQRRELLHGISQAAHSGGEITAGLLAYARRQQLHPEPIALHNFFARAQTIFQQTLGMGMSLQVSVQPLTIVADRGQLTTAMINLLTNAREASGARGTVEVTVRSVAEADGESAEISIRDHGCGMDAEQALRAIEPFYSTKEGTIARGLGLSRVYGFAQQSGGELKIDSTPGEGTTVTLVFPTHHAIGSSDPTESHAPVTTEKKVLLVDDNARVRLLLEKMLQSLGHSVSTSADGSQALSLLAEQKFDLLITDVLMPGSLSGTELASKVRAQHPKLPILLISGFAEAPDLEFPLLAKPFTVSQLKQMVDGV